jgi:hypothetical protein
VLCGLLGIIGLVLILVSKPAAVQPVTGATATRECPHCKETMRRDASVCPHCQRESKPWTFHDGRWWHTGADGVPYWLDEPALEWKRFEAPA